VSSPGNPFRRLALLATWLLAADFAPAADWPHWRGVHYDGKTTEALGNVTGLTQMWTAEAGIGFSSFSVVKGRVYTMGNQDARDTVWCFDASSGKVLWSHSYPCELHPKYYEGGTSATPTVTDEAVYTLGKQGQVFAFHPETGAVLWQRDLRADYELELPEWHFAGSPYLAKGKDGRNVLVLNVAAAGVGLDPLTGQTVWKSGPEATGYSTPVPLTADLGGSGIVALFLKKSMAGIEARTGRLTWSIPWTGLNATDPIVEGRDVLVSSIGGSALMRVEADGTAKEVWRRKDYQNYFNPPVKIGPHLYGIDGTTHRPTGFVCLEWTTGKELWREDGHATGGIIATADYLVLCDKGEIVIARPDPTKLDVVLRESVLPGTCWTAPVVAHGFIYARNAAGRVVCLRVEREP